MPNDLEIKSISEVTPKDVAYLIKYKFPFICIADTSNLPVKTVEINTEVLKNGWLVLDYGTALIASYTSHIKPQIITTQLIIVNELTKRISERGWQTPTLMESSPTMAKLAYLELLRLELQLGNYMPSEEDEKLVTQMKNTFPQAWNQLSPFKGAS